MVVVSLPFYTIPICLFFKFTGFFYLLALITIEHRKYSTTLYDKKDNFHFDIVNFLNMSCNIPSKPAYGVYISQLVRIGRICSSYEQFCERHYKLITQNLLKQGC